LWLFKKAFYFPDAAIQKSSLNPPDGEFVKARAIYTVPNGWADNFGAFRQSKAANFAPVILSVGLIREDKGAGILVEAARLLKARGRKFQVRFVGEFTSDEYRQQLLSRVKALDLEAEIEFCGRQVGDEKWFLYRNADIFCFPTFYPAESFGNVLVEAMMFELPVVATRWRAIPEIVEDGATGFLTEIKDANSVADRLDELIQNKVLRITMGRKGREQYLAKFTVEKYVSGTRDVVLEVANKQDGNCTIKTREARRLSTEAG
jgi:glycosyltransferase involved in cell wall biosynthesis